ncbi:hypothetical protein, partial [Lishizhenia sp.]|uniref:hypothetical protein n=1 Tax=Lishizhenia sp. TaxID=2497594 RepID=UPI00299F38ED
MKTSTLALSLIFTVNVVISQITEKFNSDFVFQTSGWRGDSSKFTINSLEQLQLNDNQAGTATLCRAHNINNLNWKVWEFQLRLNFSPSSGNFARVYLASPDSSLSSNSEGLYLQFGESGSGDAIRLMHQSVTISELLTGPPNLINSSFDIHLRISVDSTSLWRMEIFDTQQASFLTVDSAIVNMLLPGNYFGLYYQYTSSNATKFYFDELFVGNIPVDSFAPEINQITLINSNKLLVHFDEQIDSNSLDNVQLQTSSGTFLEHTVKYGDSPKQLLFNFSYPLVNDSLYEFELSGFNDALMNTGDTSFTTHVIFGEEVLPG